MKYPLSPSSEPNRAGYVVEIDPLDPASVPKKLTALGRLKHENAALTLAADGRVVVYLGDDERGEFLYRFVSDGRYTQGGDKRDLLESGTLFVARFADDGSGRWIALTPETTGMAAQAEICIHTRQWRLRWAPHMAHPETAQSARSMALAQAAWQSPFGIIRYGAQTKNPGGRTANGTLSPNRHTSAARP